MAVLVAALDAQVAALLGVVRVEMLLDVPLLELQRGRRLQESKPLEQRVQQRLPQVMLLQQQALQRVLRQTKLLLLLLLLLIRHQLLGVLHAQVPLQLLVLLVELQLVRRPVLLHLFLQVLRLLQSCQVCHSRRQECQCRVCPQQCQACQ